MYKDIKINHVRLSPLKKSELSHIFEPANFLDPPYLACELSRPETGYTGQYLKF